MAASGAPAARYDEWADWYENYITGKALSFTRRTGDALSQVLGRGSGPLLDLACGTGFNALTAAGLVIERVVEAGSPVPDILAVRCRR